MYSSMLCCVVQMQMHSTVPLPSRVSRCQRRLRVALTLYSLSHSQLIGLYRSSSCIRVNGQDELSILYVQARARARGTQLIKMSCQYLFTRASSCHGMQINDIAASSSTKLYCSSTVQR
jgi:hypothetical protein